MKNSSYVSLNLDSFMVFLVAAVWQLVPVYGSPFVMERLISANRVVFLRFII